MKIILVCYPQAFVAEISTPLSTWLILLKVTFRRAERRYSILTACHRKGFRPVSNFFPLSCFWSTN